MTEQLEHSRADVESRVFESVVKLMGEMPYDKIRVHHIAADAKISRNTFYRCFSNKEHVLLDIFDRQLNLQQNRIEQSHAKLKLKSNEELWRLGLTNVFNYPEFWTNLFDSGQDNLIFERIRSFFYRMIGSGLRRSKLEVNDNNAMEYLIDCMAASLVVLIKRWINSGLKQTPEEMADMCVRLLDPINSGVLRYSKKDSSESKESDVKADS